VNSAFSPDQSVLSYFPLGFCPKLGPKNSPRHVDRQKVLSTQRDKCGRSERDKLGRPPLVLLQWLSSSVYSTAQDRGARTSVACWSGSRVPRRRLSPSVAHCDPTQIPRGSCSYREHITNSVIGVSRPPVLACGTTFHPDYGGRDLPSTPSDNLWNLTYLATEALSDSIEFIGAILVNLSIYWHTFLSTWDIWYLFTHRVLAKIGLQQSINDRKYFRDSPHII